MNYDISIIIPAYNVEQHIQKCLVSIFEQEFNGSVEVIVIDDCSSDNTLAIAESTLCSRPHCKLIRHNTNQGCSSARNSGLDVATGTYITFVDPDDSLPAGALQALYNAAVEHDADIVKGNHFVINSKGACKANQNTLKKKRIFNQAVYTSLLAHKQVRGHVWGKLFKRTAIGNTRFKNGVRMAEDLLFCAEVFAKANALTIIPNNVYTYHLHGTGATGKKFITNAYLDWIESVTACKNFITHKSQLPAFNSLVVRSLLQLAREARAQNTDKKREVLAYLNEKIDSAHVCGKYLLSNAPSDVKTLVRYIKLKRLKRALYTKQSA
ncbi:glycosyltransferase family 2 protein [Saccharophagus degradans]|uniref:B-glycosyltransferase-like protein n=1 Tax=Saccharophagus degradans (strain 2-40 / ATCC 43961 / DSM 17024) TaxID=203122 RepID=Q21EV4_SACD2|nr:glycosyltransferase family 2 protein [Saccharophagus degradans]ABD82775.1 b-glycosyltransferase-like protein [Saccharophagus degradans 2-40]